MSFKNKKIKALFLAITIFCSSLLFCGCYATDFVNKYGTNITEYNLDLKLQDKKTLIGKQTVNYKNTTSNILGIMGVYEPLNTK